MSVSISISISVFGDDAVCPWGSCPLPSVPSFAVNRRYLKKDHLIPEGLAVYYGIMGIYHSFRPPPRLGLPCRSPADSPPLLSVAFLRMNTFFKSRA